MPSVFDVFIQQQIKASLKGFVGLVNWHGGMNHLVNDLSEATSPPWGHSEAKMCFWWLLFQYFLLHWHNYLCKTKHVQTRCKVLLLAVTSGQWGIKLSNLMHLQKVLREYSNCDRIKIVRNIFNTNAAIRLNCWRTKGRLSFCSIGSFHP